MLLRNQIWARLVAAAALIAGAPAAAQPEVDPPRPHKSRWPALVSGDNAAEFGASLDLGPNLERGRAARAELAEHRRLTAALAALAPQRKGVVDAYVIVVGLDSDPVFGREAREAGKVLSRRFDAAGRTLVLAGSDGRGGTRLPRGSLHALSLALARVAELIDAREDVLVLYSTSHGIPAGITYHDGDEGYGVLTPARLAALLEELGLRNRLLILSACYSGTFVPALWSDTTALFTAASAGRTSFGCAADNDWTFFGDAMINRALRKPQPLATASGEALRLVGEWEAAKKYEPSYPQVSIGSRVDGWLKPLEARMPKTATAPVGKPAARP
ncbi:MAG TPA: C13 family peptidase [Allosphingosinicella sp.]|nr:C13 family peptidase [Allosphingosinicella sp.]